jgi:hypothetical protein
MGVFHVFYFFLFPYISYLLHIMKKLLFVFLSFCRIANAQVFGVAGSPSKSFNGTLDSLRTQFQKDVEVQRYNDSIRRSSKSGYIDSVICEKMMAAHILPTPDALALVRLMNPSFVTMYPVYHTGELDLPVIPKMTRGERRSYRRMKRKALRNDPVLDTIFQLQLDTLTSIRENLSNIVGFNLKDDTLVMRLALLSHAKMNRGQRVMLHVENIMDDLVEQYRALQDQPPPDRESTVQNIYFLKDLIIDFLPPIKPTKTAIGMDDGQSSFVRPSWLLRLNMSESSSIVEKNIAGATRAYDSVPHWFMRAYPNLAPVEFYVCDSTVVRSLETILRDKKMKGICEIFCRLPSKGVKTPLDGLASSFPAPLPIVDHYFSARLKGTQKYTKEVLIDLKARFIRQALDPKMKGISPYAVIININSLMH